MFEKEAEVYVDNNFYNLIDEVQEVAKVTFKDGAEFGYNLAKEEMDYLNKHWKSEEERKANEWHDLRKNPNDLPKDKRNVWCDYGDGYGKGFYDKDDGGWWIEGHMYCSIIDAWCELPRHNKEIE